MSYQFRLQKILDMKGKEKEKAQWDLAGSSQQLFRDVQSLKSMLEEKEKMENMMLQLQQASVEIRKIKEIQAYLERLKLRVVNQKEEVKKTEMLVIKHQGVLADKNKEEKILKIMKEKDFLQYMEEEKRKEEKELGEIAIHQYIKHTGEGEL
ncbi:flagellar export protein FliJ [Microaerobacter geothermalis]|uniref:flagellar export protein FliJ n=1 Tax=Microaerobacter geothermalis TaxID=674972 RepID=UPI001F263525|nr:flagellar export protein FliJ [Microaerobacter geothermalis]MCF6093836.1 flagellar export protein FliJ [Microaerobacter geothermalis]